MISKVEEYEELYLEFKNSYNLMHKMEEPIDDLRNKIDSLEEKKQENNCLNPEVVVAWMQYIVQELTEKNKKEISDEVLRESNRLTDSNGKIHKNLERISKWISTEKIKDIVKKSEKIEEVANLEEAENIGLFNVFCGLDKLFSYIFRFEFLKKTPKFFQIIASLIVWGIVLIPNIIGPAYTRFKSQIFSLSSNQYEAVIDFKDKFIRTCVVEILLAFVFILAINIVVRYTVNYQAKQYIIRNSSVCYAVLDKKGFERSLYNKKIEEYTNTVVAVWNREIETIKNEGITEENSNIPDSLYLMMKPHLQEEYTKYSSEIEDCKKQINEIEIKVVQIKEKINKMIPELEEKKNEVRSFIKDMNYNEGVLSPYVAAGFSLKETEGVNDILLINHKNNPVIICYSDETANDITRFKKCIEIVIERLMISFLQENSHKILDIHLVDFEGLHFPVSRTMGRMHVLHTQQELSAFYDMLKGKREMIYSLPTGDGYINNINPEKLVKRENPIKYNVAFFVGVDFASHNKEIAQLYSVAENIGFVPFVFMRRSVANKILNEEDKAFSRIIKKMNDCKQIYGFENLVNELEYQVIISNQKELLNQKVSVKTITPMEEFEKLIFCDGGFTFDGSLLYVDTKDLKENVYNNIKDNKSIRFFTLNDFVPDFIKSDVIRI